MRAPCAVICQSLPGSMDFGATTVSGKPACVPVRCALALVGATTATLPSLVLATSFLQRVYAAGLRALSTHIKEVVAWGASKLCACTWWTGPLKLSHEVAVTLTVTRLARR